MHSLFRAARIASSARSAFIRIRYAILSVLLLAALFMFKFQQELVAVASDAILVHDVLVRYVGPLQITVTRRGHDLAKRNGGTGMGFSWGNEPVDSPSPSISYMAFSKSLSLSEAQLNAIGSFGRRLSIGVAKDEIATVAGPNGPLVSYSQYVKQVEQRKQFWLALALSTAGLAIVSFAGATILARADRPDA